MYPSRAYQQRVATPSRIDTILGLYDQALEKIRRAAADLGRHDGAAALLCVNKAKLAIAGLVCAI